MVETISAMKMIICSLEKEIRKISGIKMMRNGITERTIILAV